MAKQRKIESERLQRTVLHALRHDPAKYELCLDDQGWVQIDDLVLALRLAWFRWNWLEWEDMKAAIEADSTERFQVMDGRIRATYGHSIVLGHLPPPASPPDVLFHGTTRDVLPEISREGLRAIGRRFVHLTTDLGYAARISAVRSDGIVLLIDAAQASGQGVCFRKASNHVWLATEIPPTFIEFP